MHSVIQQFCHYYTNFDQQSHGEIQNTITEVYSEDIEFIDPAHRLKGLSHLQSYLSANSKALHFCRFDITQINEFDQQASITWNMQFAHPKLAAGRTIIIEGISHIKFNDKIYYHRDYFDLGAMIYEQLPLIGRLIKSIKHRMSV